MSVFPTQQKKDNNDTSNKQNQLGGWDFITSSVSGPCYPVSVVCLLEADG